MQDLVRLQTLTAMAEGDADEPQKKKMQRCFQVLSFMVMIITKADYVIGRPSRRISLHTREISKDWSTFSKKWGQFSSGCRAWTKVSTKISRT